jgi:hypothetical protein
MRELASGITTTTSNAADNSMAMQVGLRQLARSVAETNHLTRQIAVNYPSITGGTGDPDMIKFLSPALNGHVLVQSGSPAGDIYGNIVINRDHQKKELGELGNVTQAEDRFFEDGTPLTAVNAGSSTWANQYTRGGNTPRLRGDRGLFGCGYYFRFFDAGLHLWLESDFIPVEDGYMTLPDQRYTPHFGQCPDPAGNLRQNRPCGSPVPNPSSPAFDPNCWVGFDPVYGGDYNNFAFGPPLMVKAGSS